jgi:hypothetical protein
MSMRHTRLISAAVGALFVVGSLAGCSSSDVKDAATSKANDLKASATAKAGAMAASAAASAVANADVPDAVKQKATEILDKISPEAKQKLAADLTAAGVEADAGSFADQPTATLAEQYLAARQAALGNGDVSALQQIATPRMVTKAQRYAKKKAARAGKPYVIRVVGDGADGTQVCLGAKGKKAKVVLSNDQGQVSGLHRGTYTC